MKILHLDSGREMRGGQWQALRLHRGLLTRGHESLLLTRPGSPLSEVAGREGLRAGTVGSVWTGYDIVHAHDARSHTLAAIRAKAPLVVSRRVGFAVKDSVFSRWKYRRPKLFIAISRYVAQQLRNAGVADDRITVVYDGIPVPSNPADGEGKNAAILIPATTDPEKGMALAQEAARIAGVEVQISNNLADDLPRAAGLLYLTRSEGLGSGILLGMAHGLAVIASNVGGIPELIRDGETGILVPNETGPVAEALRRFTPALRHSMGRAARATVIERFTEDRMVDSTIAAYERVLKHA
ncbi:MAG TPA: glycosyltransferase family 4 protein [Bryobacteraceae bacterium]|jgi:glycosyltransferase involved in cell wall biosynthesis|nr:glycosyltransferase family 4 protein [Bryobacteraceae bacterium]